MGVFDPNAVPQIEPITPFRGAADGRRAQFPSRRGMARTPPDSFRRKPEGVTVPLGQYLAFSSDLIRLALVLLVIFAVSRVHEQYTVLVMVRQAVLFALVVSLIAFGTSKQFAFSNVTSTWPTRVILGLGIAACVSIPFGLSIGASGQFLLMGYSKVLILSLLVAAGIRGTRDLFSFLAAFMAGGSILGLLALFVFRVAAMGTSGMNRIVGGDYVYSFDANDIGTLASAGIGIALMFFFGRRGLLKYVGAATALVLVAAIARTGSRGGFLGLIAVGLGFTLFGATQVWKRVLFILVAAGGLILAAPPKYWEQMQTSFREDDYNRTDPTGRVAIWKRGFGYMLSHPLTGVGVGQFSRAEGTISPLAREHRPGMPGVKWTAPHNSFVEIGAEMGFPGLALFSGLVLGGIVGMLRLRRRVPASWREGTEEERFLYHAPTGLALAMLGFAVGGSFVSFAHLDLVYIIGALMAGTYVCVRQALDRHPTPAEQPSRRRRVAVSG